MGKQKPSNLGKCPKWIKKWGARLVNKWKQRADNVNITCLFSWQLANLAAYKWSVQEKKLGILVKSRNSERLMYPSSTYSLSFSIFRFLKKFLREITKWVFLSIFPGRGRGTCLTTLCTCVCVHACVCVCMYG